MSRSASKCSEAVATGRAAAACCIACTQRMCLGLAGTIYLFAFVAAVAMHAIELRLHCNSSRAFMYTLALDMSSMALPLHSTFSGACQLLCGPARLLDTTVSDNVLA